MFSNWFRTFFPTPRFLMAPSCGLDISDESLKFIELNRKKRGIVVSRYGEKKIPPGIIESGKIKDSRRMEQILSSLKDQEKIKSVRVSLPEEQVYLFTLSLEKEGLESIRESIELALEEYIPIPAEDAIFDYEILREEEKSLKLQVAAIPKNVIEEYLSVFSNAGIFVPSFELEAQAIMRSVIKKGDMSTYMMVDFGKKRTGIFIISKGVVVFTSTLELGGVSLIKMIEKNFKMSTAEAEKKKVEWGLRRNPENTEVFSVLLNGVSILRDEMVKHFLYWHTHKDEEGKDRPPIEKVIMCGGEANLIGLVGYLSVSMKIKVELADVWVNMGPLKKDIPEIPFNESLTLAPALGLALGDFEHN